MFCAMAFVPAALVFWLTWRQADLTVRTAEQRDLRAETRFVAFTLLSRLQSAEALLTRIAAAGGVPDSNDADVFDAVVRRTLANGVDTSRLSRLHVSTVPGAQIGRAVLLVARPQPDGSTVIYAGTLSPRYLWRADEDVVEGTRICIRSSVQALGCGGEVTSGARTIRTSWDLDLKTEYGAPVWRFDAERESGAAPALRVHWFALLAAGVLLMAMLMSLVQIRRTLVPLEALIDRIRAFSGSRRAVQRNSNSDELATLSHTFDEMQQRIGGQLARLHGLSAVDGEIVSRQPLSAILESVAEQLRALPGVLEAAVIVEVSASGPRDVYPASNSAHERHKVLQVIDSVRVERDGDPWQRVVTPDEHDGAGSVWYRLSLAASDDHRAWAVVALDTRAERDPETLDAARQLADRVAIALALDARERRLVHQSRHDALTGLPNRLAIIEELEAAIATSSRPFAVVFMDLDRFKSVNDGLGHALGDALLAEIAARLASTLSADDVVARLGGDEFVLLLRDVAGMDDIDAVRARIDTAFGLPVTLGDHVMAIRYSAGVAFHPVDGDDAHDLLRKADVAMYRAKQEGGGRFAAYSAGMNEAAREEVELVAALRVALSDEALDVHYQPRIDPHTRQWQGMEALARWHDPQRGWIPPSKFVPLAERHGLIDALGALVLRKTCAQIAAWRALGFAPGRVAINVSSEQLRAGTLVDDIGRVLLASGAEWSDLEIEITESLLIADAETSSRQLQALRDLGVHVAIDDFGTGYSSLAYLARLPLDTIKIDRAFVVALDEPGTASVVRSILALATALGKRVVTEGVETESQLQVLQSWGCDVFQGYLFYRPMPAADVGTLLAAASAGAVGSEKSLAP